jgi:hypothetical protein
MHIFNAEKLEAAKEEEPEAQVRKLEQRAERKPEQSSRVDRVTATVTRVIADRLNDGAAPQDRVSGGALQDRVRRNEGVKMADRQNNPEPKRDRPETRPAYKSEVAMKYAKMLACGRRRECRGRLLQILEQMLRPAPQLLQPLLLVFSE